MTSRETTTALDGFRGRLLQPHDEEYEVARRIWNGAVDRRPAMIARCTSAADVAAAVRFAVHHDLMVAVRGGGHSIPGHSVCDGGMMIDLSLMRQVDVDAAAKLADVQPGVLLGELDTATQAYGLATPGGEISHTGVAGLTLGGGVGWLSRKHGLACDNLISAELVSADGEIRTVDEDNDPELLWGLRGGGGNFGVVTRFTFTLHDVGPVLGGGVVFPVDRAREALHRYAELCAEAPDELSLTVAGVTAPPDMPPGIAGRPAVVLGMAWFGDPADGQRWADQLRALRPALDALGTLPYTALQSMVDAGVPHGLGYYVKSEWLGPLDDKGIDDLLTATAAMPGPGGQVLLRQLGGAIARVPADATAVGHRDASSLLTIATSWRPGTQDPQPHRDWARGLWEETLRLSSGGAYVNQIDADEGIERVRSAYGAKTWDRLVALKTRLDPDNVFRLNQNIPPQR